MDQSLPLRTSFWMISHWTSPLAITNSSKRIRSKGHKTSRKPCRQLKPPNTTAMGPAADGCRPWGLPMLPEPQKQAPKPWLSLLPAGQLLQVHLRSFGEAQVFLRWPGRGSLERNTGDLDVTWWAEIKHSCHRPHIHSNYDSNPYVILLVPTETLGLSLLALLLLSSNPSVPILDSSLVAFFILLPLILFSSRELLWRGTFPSGAAVKQADPLLACSPLPFTVRAELLLVQPGS